MVCNVSQIDGYTGVVGIEIGILILGEQKYGIYGSELVIRLVFGYNPVRNIC